MPAEGAEREALPLALAVDDDHARGDQADPYADEIAVLSTSAGAAPVGVDVELVSVELEDPERIRIAVEREAANDAREPLLRRRVGRGRHVVGHRTVMVRVRDWDQRFANPLFAATRRTADF